MGETNSQTPPATSMTPRIAADRLKKGVIGNFGHYEDFVEVKPSEEYIVRVRKNQVSVAFTLNTKRMVERREIEQANDLKRCTGRYTARGRKLRISQVICDPYDLAHDDAPFGLIRSPVMIHIDFTAQDIDALHHERFHHPHPRVQLKMEAVYLKSQGLPHHDICRLARISENTLRTCLRHYQEGGIERLKRTV